MDSAHVKELFNGIAIIIDDEIYEDGEQIQKIKDFFITSNIPVATYADIPNVEVIKSFSHASLVILDWDYSSSNRSSGADIGDELKKEQKKQLIDFIKELLCKTFVPLFIFTGFSEDAVKSELAEKQINSSRIFVKEKNSINSEADLFSEMEKWLSGMPSVYALKEWESIAQRAKDEMFLELYEYSSNWAAIIWALAKIDSKEASFEFGNFITRNLVNRINGYKFCEESFKGDKDDENEINRDELAKLIEGERYLKYPNDSIEQLYTGDLFKKQEKYYLNIRAQCDISRREPKKVEMYLLVGKAVEQGDIACAKIELTNDEKLKINGNTYDLSDLKKAIDKLKKDPADRELIEINENLKNCFSKTSFLMGDIIEKKPEVFIPYVDDGKFIKFNLSISIKKISELGEAKRIGRILPPYITRIQQKCGQYIFRQGLMPIPEALIDTANKKSV